MFLLGLVCLVHPGPVTSWPNAFMWPWTFYFGFTPNSLLFFAVVPIWLGYVWCARLLTLQAAAIPATP